MTEKRFTTMWKPETTFSRFWIARDNWEKKLNANDVVALLNEQHEEIEKLKREFDSCGHNWALMYDETKEKVEKQHNAIIDLQKKCSELTDSLIAQIGKSTDLSMEVNQLRIENMRLKELRK